MKRRHLLKHISANGCQLTRHGRKHDIFLNPETGRKARFPGSWSITAEETGVIREHAGAQPDIIVRPPAGMPIVLETEYDPARTVEDDAKSRLGRVLRDTGDILESVLAVRIPVHLGEGGGDLSPGILSGQFRWCAFSGLPVEGRPVSRWPASDWLDGGIDDLADCVEQVSLSEQRIAEGLEVLERAVRNSAARLRRASLDRSPEVLTSIARVLHQEDGDGDPARRPSLPGGDSRGGRLRGFSTAGNSAVGRVGMRAARAGETQIRASDRRCRRMGAERGDCGRTPGKEPLTVPLWRLLRQIHFGHTAQYLR